MDSEVISTFLESTYPEPPLMMESTLGLEIQSKARTAVGPAFRISITPREIHILNPRSQVYFRQTRETSLGHPLEELLASNREQDIWKAQSNDIESAGKLMRINKDRGPFIMGAIPSYVDFLIAGSIQSARVVDEGVFRRITSYPGYGDIYTACLPFMEKQD